MRLRIAAALTLALFPALAFAHPTDTSLHAHRALSSHSGKMHTREAVARRA